MITPMLHMSHLSLYAWFFDTSGAKRDNRM